jgi:hypothetical protein
MLQYVAECCNFFCQILKFCTSAIRGTTKVQKGTKKASINTKQRLKANIKKALKLGLAAGLRILFYACFVGLFSDTEILKNISKYLIVSDFARDFSEVMHGLTDIL